MEVSASCWIAHPCAAVAVYLTHGFIKLQVVDLLCISDAEATRALRFYKWDLGKLQVRHSGFSFCQLRGAKPARGVGRSSGREIRCSGCSRLSSLVPSGNLKAVPGGM